MASRARAVLGLLALAAAVGKAAPQLLAAGPGGSPSPSAAECRSECGGVDIPFPFGGNGSSDPRCRRHLPGFEVECRRDKSGVFKPFLMPSDIEVESFSLSSGQVLVPARPSYYCYDPTSAKKTPLQSEWWWDLRGTPFTFSDTANRFNVMGCRTLAYIGDSKDDAATYKTGCVSMCRPDDLSDVRNGSCAGRGCCQTAIPKGLRYNQVWFEPRLSAWERSPCSYAVLSSNFNFTTNYVTSDSGHLQDGLVRMVLDWAVGQDDCSVASKKPNYACVSANHQCIPAASGTGYICKCSQGFQGNPYLTNGCQDINECDYPTQYPCYGVCTNTEGKFNCSCRPGTRGNASLAECQSDPFTPGNLVAAGICAALLVALVAFLAFEVFRKQRSNKMQGYFEQHGGKMLARILETEGANFAFYKRGDILKATRQFHKSNVVGEGAHGTVYAGVLSVGGTATTVAVKRCKELDVSRTEEFVQELVILCRVNHPNVVKLLGCCLHFEAPVLVYEFARNGTLNELLHGRRRGVVVLATRLRIVAEAAEALAHLHSPPHPTLHGDVKPENILLGEGWVAKVSDFGCSTLDDNVQVVPKGTLAYLAPEFLQDFQITEKTDVYSLGVVLMEVLTGKKPPSKGQKNLRIIFQECLANGTLAELLDPDIITVEEGASTGVIRRAAELASRCTAVPATTRPAMRQVAEELRRLSNQMPESSLALQDLEGPGGYSYAGAGAESETTAFYGGVGSIAALNTEHAR